MDIAICAIGYNRVHSMERLLRSIQNADYSPSDNITLYVSVDKSDSDNVASLADTFEWSHGNKVVIRHEQNLGLRRHILSCGDLLEHHDALIVLEDDIVVAPAYFKYAQQTVGKYHDNPEIAGISLYCHVINQQTHYPFTPLKVGHDVYFMNFAFSWGQIWLKKQWQEFISWYKQHEDFIPNQPHLPKMLSGWNKSWLKYHIQYCIEQNKYFVVPYFSFSTNCGDPGTHVGNDIPNICDSPMENGPIGTLHLPDIEQGVIYDGFFENKTIANLYGETYHDDITINLNCADRPHKRFLLTCADLDYEIITGYALDRRPMELNILQGISGSGIYLYDTTRPQKNKRKSAPNRFFTYMYKSYSVTMMIRRYGIKRLLKEVNHAILKRVKL